jgi:hypothetical protein
MGFYFVVLVSSLEVGKRVTGARQISFWNITFPVQTSFEVTLQLGRGTPKVNAWGENHLWVRDCKVSNLSGLGEPRILVPLG